MWWPKSATLAHIAQCLTSSHSITNGASTPIRAGHSQSWRTKDNIPSTALPRASKTRTPTYNDRWTRCSNPSPQLSHIATTIVIASATLTDHILQARNISIGPSKSFMAYVPRSRRPRPPRRRLHPRYTRYIYLGTWYLGVCTCPSK